MGLFRKLSGSQKHEDVAPTADTMPDDQFWEIVHKSFKKAKGDYENQLEALASALQKLSPLDILLFNNKFRQLRGLAYRWDIWGAAYIVNGGCGDDSFLDFRGWIIAQGKDFYNNTLTNPETLAAINNERIEVDWEGIGYIAPTVFEEKTGVKLPNGFIENQQILGEEWDEEGDGLQRRFPKLWAKYSSL